MKYRKFDIFYNLIKITISQFQKKKNLKIFEKNFPIKYKWSILGQTLLKGNLVIVPVNNED